MNDSGTIGAVVGPGEGGGVGSFVGWAEGSLEGYAEGTFAFDSGSEPNPDALDGVLSLGEIGDLTKVSATNDAMPTAASVEMTTIMVENQPLLFSPYRRARSLRVLAGGKLFSPHSTSR